MDVDYVVGDVIWRPNISWYIRLCSSVFFLEQVFYDDNAVEYVCFCAAVLPDDGPVRPETCRSFLKC
jgi:hypothetical protein